MRKELHRLIELDREVTLLEHIDAVLNWDRETYLPPKAVDERAEQVALVECLAHERRSAQEIGGLLEALGSTSENPRGDPSLSETEGAYLRALRRSYDRETKLPASLVSQLAKTVSIGQAAWVEARKNNDFPFFAPHLERMIALKREEADCLSSGGHASRYDALLDIYEPGCTEASLKEVFSKLAADLGSLLGKIAQKPQIDDSFLSRPCPAERQKAISDYLMAELGYDLGSGRLDEVAHPFTTTLGASDVRITTRYLENSLVSNIFSTIHETGHALYEQGIAPDPQFARTRLGDPASMAIHESQSRLWENIIGRSEAFWKPRYHRLAQLAGPTLEGISRESFVAAINKVSPSQIRIEADEVTYALHIILRFELESQLLSGSLSVRDLPEAWNQKAQRLLGIKPASDAEGCLQDVHWSDGLIGYFPSYALGNLYGAQFWDAMGQSKPEIPQAAEKGDFSLVLDWLRTNIHRHGAAYLPGELVQRGTGASLDPQHFTNYLNKKYSELYGF